MVKSKNKTIATASSKDKPKTEVWIKKEVYGQAPEQYHFVLASGEKLKDLKELNQALEKMSEEVFKYHVNGEKNDFSTWIKDIFKEDSLANEIKKFNTRIEHQLTVQKHINNKLEKVIKKLTK